VSRARRTRCEPASAAARKACAPIAHKRRRGSAYPAAAPPSPEGAGSTADAPFAAVW
jgi:hypothetical protein